MFKLFGSGKSAATAVTALAGRPNDTRDAQIAALKEGLRIVSEERNLAIAERDDAHVALREIARQETRWANATVKRMAALARQGLPIEIPGALSKGHFVKAEAQKERA